MLVCISTVSIQHATSAARKTSDNNTAGQLENSVQELCNQALQGHRLLTIYSLDCITSRASEDYTMLQQ